MELRDKITQLRRDRDAHQMDEPDYVDKVMALIKRESDRARLDEIGAVKTIYGNYLAETYIHGQAITVTNRYEELKAELSEGENHDPIH